MVIEMLLISDIKKKWWNDFALSKGNKCNYVHYYKKNFNHFIWTKFQ